MKSYRSLLIPLDVVGTLATAGIGYPFVSPIIHLAEGNHSAAWRSLALRIGLPVGGVVVFGGLGMLYDRHSTCPTGDGCTEALEGAMIGFVAGALTAMMIDWRYLAEKPDEEEPVAWVPVVSVHGDRTTLSIVRRF